MSSESSHSGGKKDKSNIIENLTGDNSSDELFADGDVGQAFLEKSKIVSRTIDEIGFGRYQYGLLFVAGLGWFADNAWPVATSLVWPLLTETNGVQAPVGRGSYMVLAQNLGLLAGAFVWSLSADVIGRRWAFNLTFLITGIFATCAGASPTFAAICVFAALWSFGVGGNLPVDSAIFLESLPSSHQWLLTAMSVFWALGQLVANLIAWGLLANYSCETTTDCLSQDNKGWRYFLYTMGGLSLLMFIGRFAFRVFESAQFYIARGDDEKAVETLHRIAKINGKKIDLTVDDFKVTELVDAPITDKNFLLKEKLSKFNLSHVRECFASKKLAISTVMVVLTWALIGLAFPLYNAFIPYYLRTRATDNQELSTYETYRNSLIVSVMGIPASLIAAGMVELKIGRKGTLSISLLLTGVILFCTTTATTSNANLGWTCAFSFVSNIMYGVLYAYTPEVFPSKIRGTAIGIAASANRILGVFAPIIGMFADLTTSAPIFVSGALFLASGIFTIFFPYEPRGKSSL